MSLRSALSNLIAPPASDPNVQTDKRNEIASSFFGSKRFVLVIALIAFIYLTYQLLNIEIIKLIANVAIFYIVGESLSNVATTVMNGLIKLAEVKHDIEYERLDRTNPVVTKSTPATPTP